MKTLDKIKVMQAFVENKEVQYSHRPLTPGDKRIWYALESNPIWNWEKIVYRIKPKPIWWRVLTMKGESPWLEWKAGDKPDSHISENNAGVVVIQDWQQWVPE